MGNATKRNFFKKLILGDKHRRNNLRNIKQCSHLVSPEKPLELRFNYLIGIIWDPAKNRPLNIFAKISIIEL